MKVAQIAAPPMLRNMGMRLPTSAQVNPNNASTTIHTLISFGRLPVSTKPAISPPSRMKTGIGMMPMRSSMSRHQPSGQKCADGAGVFTPGVAVVLSMAGSCRWLFERIREDGEWVREVGVGKDRSDRLVDLF